MSTASSFVDRLGEHLAAVYGESTAQALTQELLSLIAAFNARRGAAAAPAPDQTAPQVARFDQRDALLITYGDQIQTPGEAPLRTLYSTLRKVLGDELHGVHILPFYPYTSDDGFSVTDYAAVDPALGDWSDVAAMAADYRLMFDAVINHISQASVWFAGFKRDEAPYRDYFIVVDPATDLSQVVRPRALPLLTEVRTAAGPRHVWATFSEDQIDLNYASPALLLEIVRVLLFYVEQGAQLIRLDAIGFMWKEIGTSCIHLPQTHRLIQLMRTVLDATAPAVLLVTETNVPHAENVSYFGDGYNEAQMVYNFTLPPLTLHAFYTGDASHLTRWAATLVTPSPATTFFNFMASHDGIGLRPLEGILKADDVAMMAERVQRHGGLVSYRNNPDGSRSPYEFNVVYYDALNDPAAAESQELQVARFMASQAILLCLAGVPGIYVHSLFGSRNWLEGVAETGRNRTINRRKFQRAELEAALADPTTVAHQIFMRYRTLLRIRRSQAAFHPNGEQRVLALHPALFAVLRTAPDQSSRVLCLHNVSGTAVEIDAQAHSLVLPAMPRWTPRWTDLLGGRGGEHEPSASGDSIRVMLHPYGVAWLHQEVKLI